MTCNARVMTVMPTRGACNARSPQTDKICSNSITANVLQDVTTVYIAHSLTLFYSTVLSVARRRDSMDASLHKWMTFPQNDTSGKASTNSRVVTRGRSNV